MEILKIFKTEAGPLRNNIFFAASLSHDQNFLHVLSLPFPGLIFRSGSQWIRSFVVSSKPNHLDARSPRV